MERENKRMTEYNLPSKLAAEGRKVRGGGQARGEGNCSPALHATPSGPSRPGPAPSWPPCPGAGRSLPPYRTLPGRASSGAGPPPWLASPREKAGQFSPLLGRGDSRGDVNTASPAARGPSPPPGSVTSSLSPAPRPALPVGRRAERLPLSPSPAPRPLPGATNPLPPLPAGVTATTAGKPLRKPRSKQHRRGAGDAEGGGGTRDSEA